MPKELIEMVAVQCSHCNSNVNIPKRLKEMLDAAKTSSGLVDSRKLPQIFEDTKEYNGMPFFISPLTGSVYCNSMCLELYCQD
ncbi:MAG: hypothetical protein ABH840_00585 [Nanoarchaeota archaeon]